ncbi:hypothetical protein MCANUFG1_02141 [Mycoplasmopsis canis UFG1]|uniref:hypothetical protein n=1 Tax=Mycoplasmopsis canis TaxID=29555 RepID=UPI00025B012B|nr:hypothetical protein [Mycoplasmopsis canis]EIE41636.1 hypothetical protein MCANUFG1_02141 [Mycoplasmopsis canis UFG1]
MKKKIFFLISLLAIMPLSSCNVKENDVVKINKSETSHNEMDDEFKIDERWFNLLNNLYSHNFDNNVKLKLLTNDQSWVILKMLKNKKYNYKYKKLIEEYLNKISIDNNLEENASFNLNYLLYLKETLEYNWENTDVDKLIYNEEKSKKEINDLKKIDINIIAELIKNDKNSKFSELAYAFAHTFFDVLNNNIDFTKKFSYYDHLFRKKYKFNFNDFEHHTIGSYFKRLITPYVSDINQKKKYWWSHFDDELRKLFLYPPYDDEKVRKQINKKYNEGKFLSIKNIIGEYTNDKNIKINFQSNRNLLDKKENIKLITKEYKKGNYLFRFITLKEYAPLYSYDEFKSIYKEDGKKRFSNKNFSGNFYFSLDTNKLFSKNNSELKEIYILKTDNIFINEDFNSFDAENFENILNNYYNHINKEPDNLVLSIDEFMPIFKTGKEYLELFKKIQKDYDMPISSEFVTHKY